MKLPKWHSKLDTMTYREYIITGAKEINDNILEYWSKRQPLIFRNVLFYYETEPVCDLVPNELCNKMFCKDCRTRFYDREAKRINHEAILLAIAEMKI
jgi:hypothetical protein